MLQNLTVAVIVMLAALYACAKFFPAGWRQQIVYALARRGADQSRLARLFSTEASCGSGCDSCKACASDETPTAPSGQRVIKLHVRR